MMKFKKILGNGMMLCLLLSVILPVTLKADEIDFNDINFSGLSYSHPGIIDGGYFYIADFNDGGWYTIIEVPFVTMIRTILGDDPVSDRLSKFQYVNMLGIRFGTLFGSDKFAVGIGGLGGMSGMGEDGNTKTSGMFYLGVEIPVKFAPVKSLPLLFLPYWTGVYGKLGDGYANTGTEYKANRFGLDILANYQVFKHLSFQLTWGIHHTNRTFDSDLIKDDSGIAYNWLVGIGSDIVLDLW